MSEQVPQQVPQQQLDNLVISNQNEALNVIAQFLHLAQRRGAFTLPESSKVYECLRFFQVQERSSGPPSIVPQESDESLLNKIQTM